MPLEKRRSLTEAAKTLGISRARVSQIRKGLIEQGIEIGTEYGGVVFVTPKEMETINKARRARGGRREGAGRPPDTRRSPSKNVA